ncbi:MAG: DUF5683 domain-containing protein [Candidatus Kryptoniota bacterium]
MAILLTVNVQVVTAQSDTSSINREKKKLLVTHDTVVTSSSDDSVKVTKKVSILSDRGKSPLVAVLLSVAVPGGGQIYNGSYWKAPIVIGLQGFFVSQWISSNKMYRYYRDQYQNSIVSMPPYGNPYIKAQRDAWRDQRDSYAWYMAVTAVLSVVDAYVDAQLSQFDVSPSLSLYDLPDGSKSIALSLQMKF